MPPKYTPEEIKEQKQVAIEMEKIFKMLGENPHYKPRIMENDWAQNASNVKKLKDIRHDIRIYKKILSDYELGSIKLTKEKLEDIHYNLKYLETWERAMKHHVSGKIIPDLLKQEEENAEMEEEELNRMVGKRGGSRRRRTARKRRGTRRA
jgi:hypothetical protein